MPSHDMRCYMRQLTETNDDVFYVANLNTIKQRLREFVTLLPRVMPFYAVKCNPTPAVLRTIASFGAGFDVASLTEIKAIADIVPPQKLSTHTIYANPVKQQQHLIHANRIGIDLLTFDNHLELVKIARFSRNARLLLRIAVDDSLARIPLTSKFGAHVDEIRDLLKNAMDMQLNVVGVAFHVGSGAKSATPYLSALKRARNVFDMAESLGMQPFTILDIGGGFPAFNGEVDVSFREIALTIRPVIDNLFSSQLVNIMAEPGRFIVGAAFSLVAKIMNRRIWNDRIDYFIADGVYGSFKDAILLNMSFDIRLLRDIDSTGNNTEVCNVLGPTGQPNDVILRDVKNLPRCNVGDCVVFDNMGAYTIALASNIADLPRPPIHFLQ